MYKIILSILFFILSIAVGLFWSVGQHGSFYVNLKYMEDRIFSAIVITFLFLSIFFLRKYISPKKS